MELCFEFLWEPWYLGIHQKYQNLVCWKNINFFVSQDEIHKHSLLLNLLNKLKHSDRLRLF